VVETRLILGICEFSFAFFYLNSPGEEIKVEKDSRRQGIQINLGWHINIRTRSLVYMDLTVRYFFLD